MNVPVDLFAEEALLGAVLASEDALLDTIAEVGSEDFHSPRNAGIWRAVETLWQQRVAVNQVTVANVLSRRSELEDAGGQSHLAELVASTPTTVGCVHWARLIRQMAIRRRLISLASDIAFEAERGEGDPAEMALVQATRMVDITRQGRAEDAPEMRAIVQAELGDAVAEWLENPAGRRGVTTGLRYLDRAIGGYQPTRLHVVGADTSAGKSVFAQHAALCAVRSGVPTLLCTTEMSRVETGERLLGMVSGTNPVAIGVRGKVYDGEAERINLALGEMSELPLRVRQGTLSLPGARALVRRLRHSWGLGLVVIDHLDMMEAPGHRSREEMLGAITSGLKDLAVEEQVPVVAISHLNREGQKRRDEGGWPRLSDLFGASAKERDANIVITLSAAKEGHDGWMPMTRDEIDELPLHRRDHVLRVHLVKNRHGFVGPSYAWLRWSQGGRIDEYE